ncbi:MAG: nucleotidyltransferase domain-containing protein [Actinomycetota bacterium]|nr:nucleotidyltransferase domain-containing protein [Actinomycetota bacterium]
MTTLAEAALSAAPRRVIGHWFALLVEEMDVVSVWLFGSRARGDHEDGSDVDLLVIARTEGAWEAARTAARLVERVAAEDGSSPVGYAVHVWTPEHLEGRREIKSFFLREVDRDKVKGRPLRRPVSPRSEEFMARRGIALPARPSVMPTTRCCMRRERRSVSWTALSTCSSPRQTAAGPPDSSPRRSRRHRPLDSAMDRGYTIAHISSPSVQRCPLRRHSRACEEHFTS